MGRSDIIFSWARIMKEGVIMERSSKAIIASSIFENIIYRQHTTIKLNYLLDFVLTTRRVC
jgi:hypothetical protein